MKKLMTISAMALLAASLSSAAFAQVGGGGAATIPENSGTATNGQGAAVGTTTTGRTTLNRDRVGTTGMSGGTMVAPNNAELQGNNGNSASGSNSLANPNTAAGAR
jgi:hypothetical protein